MLMVKTPVSIVTAFFADRFGQRGLNIVFFATIAMIGFSIFYGESSLSILTSFS